MPQPPSAELVEPVSYDPFPDLVENIVGAAQYVSPAYWIGVAWQQMTGTDPYLWVVQHWAGDYEAVQKAGLALEHLAEFHTVFGAAIRNAEAEAIPYDWRGNAAESAEEYFRRFADAVTTQADALQRVGGQFKTMAFGVYEAAQGFKGFFQMLVDRAVILAIQLIKAAFQYAIPGGAVVSALEITISILQGRWLWQKALSMHDKAWQSVQLFTGVVSGYLGGLKGMELVPLPAGDYDHPGV